RDANDGLAIAAAQVSATNQESGREEKGTTDSRGHYRLFMTAGTYSVTVSKPAYSGATALVEDVVGQTAEQDFTMETALISLAPRTLQMVLPAGGVRQSTVSLGNAGGVPLDFVVAESGGRRAQVVATAKLEREAS